MRAEEQKPVEKIKRKKGPVRKFFGSVLMAFCLGFLVLVGINIYVWATSSYEVMIQRIERQYDAELTAMSVRSEQITAFTAASLDLINEKFDNLVNISKRAAKSIHLPTRLQIFSSTESTSKDKNMMFGPDFFKGLYTASTSHLKLALTMLWGTFVVLVLKFVSVFAGVMLYLFAGLLGTLDGLVSRYIRTAEGGRESAFVFHKMTGVIIQIPILIAMIYLISPILISPMYVIGALALSFFMIFNVGATNLKKYL